MKDVIFDDYQNLVHESLLRHKSILDISTKLQDSQARINRALAKSVTNCGCLQIEAKKQHMPNEEDDIESLKNCLQTHLKGEICENCREVLEREIGNNLFYLTSLCNVVDISLYDVLLREYDRINTLGKYTLR
jgi:NTP pyrophosphatase (non-canonical NTP hydrolase)